MGESTVDQVKDAVEDQATSDDEDALVAPLKKAAVAAAVAALTPVVKDAVTNAAEQAAKEGPEMLANAGGAKGVAELAKDKLVGEEGGGLAKGILGAVSGGGGAGGLAKGVLGAVTGAGGSDGGSGGEAPPGYGSGRRTPVQQAVDVAAPIDIVYNQFTQFEEYPKVMHRVESVSQEDEAHVTFRSKQWAVNRQWRAEILDQRPDERIAWKSDSGVKLTGVATFHELAPRLTRIEVNVDFDPEGFFEKVGRGMRFAKRSIRADLHGFKAYVEMKEEEDGEWRGYISEGEAVDEDEYFGEETDEPDQAEPVGEEEEAEEAPSRAASSRRPSSGSSRAGRSRSSSDGRRSKSSSRTRSQWASGDGAKASRGGDARSSARSRQKRRQVIEVEERSKQDLEQRAKELGIQGRSKVNKGELVDALRKSSKSSS